ncbi:DUF4287 domain-containing protein [Fulvivirga sp. RKSG066]|uniref:DUF5655 domain-containing protein n=1 Tax=Fulvivirga aurantia TaxID=2529383 RepID=UPI0012BC6854|nr:DUF5655 domain-containing protein [Fulvivirga aurantia]MTI21313.1 DUF4287 domain-containing protein [Fulvivirga aurantia]
MKTAFQLEKEFVATVNEKTGQSLEKWMSELENKDFKKMKEAVDYLKKEREINHMNATFIAGIYLNDGELVNDPKSLLKKHFVGKEDKQELYKQIEQAVSSAFKTVQVVPTKGYISFRNPKEFAVAKINKKEIRVGLDLGEQEFDAYTQKAKSLGTMPRISHMVEITTPEEVNEKLKSSLAKANQIVNN